MRLAVSAAVLIGLALAGAAGAAVLTGTDGADLIVGTRAADTVSARAGADRVLTWGDGRRDRVGCGAGVDLVNAERNDRVDRDCETVAVQISRDRTTGAQRGTQVEPDSASHGSTVVTVFQSGRFANGGAVEIGFSTSKDGGRSWIEGTLPRPEAYTRVSDPVVIYDAARDGWLATMLGISETRGTALLVTGSADGIRWRPPVAAVGPRRRGAALDKQWIVCDDGAASTFRGRCYLAFTDLADSAIAVSTSDDGGRTWSPPVAAFRFSRAAVGALPVVRPAGDLVLFLTDRDEGTLGVRSTDGGASFARVGAGGAARFADVRGVRAPQLVSADVDRSGRVMAVWASCAFRSGCAANDIVLTESSDGVTWSAQRRLPTRTLGTAFLPTVAIDQASGRIGVLFYAATRCAERCRIDAWLIESADGRTWSKPLRLSAQSMELPWIARANGGAMLADYISLSYLRGRPIAVFAIAREPLADRRRQSIFALTRVPALAAR